MIHTPQSLLNDFILYIKSFSFFRCFDNIEYVVIITTAYSLFSHFSLIVPVNLIIFLEFIVVHFSNSFFHYSTDTSLSHIIIVLLLIISKATTPTTVLPAPQGNIIIPERAFLSINMLLRAFS